MIELLLTVMLILAIAALVVRDLLTSVILAGVLSLISCLVFVLLNAPDVALTEAAVGTGIGSVVLIWVVFATQRKVDRGTSR